MSQKSIKNPYRESTRIKKTPVWEFFMVGIKRRSSNFLKYIKELIEELKKSETVLLLEYYRLFKQTYILSEYNINCHAELVSASNQ